LGFQSPDGNLVLLDRWKNKNPKVLDAKHIFEVLEIENSLEK
jgi:hypothetical protein